MSGPHVFLDYDQAVLDAAYDQSVWAPNMEQLRARLALASDATRRRLGEPLRFSYGSTGVETVDVYVAGAGPAPVHIFIHGGAWRAGSARGYAFPADMMVAAGVHYVAIDFTSVLEVSGNLSILADQVRRAVAWVYCHAADFGGDPNRLYLSGHSSGGHLASVVLTTDWVEYGVPQDIIRAGACISGMYDLKPVRLSARSSYVTIDDASEEALSALRHIDRLNAPLLIGYGTLESPEFQRQARDFVAAVRDAGKPVDVIVAEQYNHFEIAETFGNPFGPVGSALLEQMGRADRFTVAR
jgi:arylformamidase